MGQLDIVVVNLVRSTERRANMISLLEPLGLPYSFFEAVDGRAGHHPLFDRFDPRLAEVRRGFTLTAGELGCYASHFLLWEKSVRENRALLIFEDDAGLNDNFVAAYKSASAHIDKRGLIRFSGHKRRDWAKVETIGNGLDLIRLKIGPHGTSAYAISPAAAAKLIATAGIWFEPVDCHLDRFWTHGVECFGISPWPVSHLAETEEQSEIWQGTRREKKSRRFRKLRALYRARDDIGRFLSNLRYLGQWKS